MDPKAGLDKSGEEKNSQPV